MTSARYILHRECLQWFYDGRKNVCIQSKAFSYRINGELNPEDCQIAESYINNLDINIENIKLAEMARFNNP